MRRALTTVRPLLRSDRITAMRAEPAPAARRALASFSTAPSATVATAGSTSGSPSDLSKVGQPPAVSTSAAVQRLYEQSLAEDDYFGVRSLVRVRQLFDHRVHLGHKLGSLNPHMDRYLYGQRLGICIIDLEQTARLLQDALNFVAHIAFRGGIILFVNNSKETAYLAERTAIECNEFSHCRPFQLNTFANSERFFGTVVRLPDLVIFLRTQDSVFSMHTAVNHCAKLLIPTVGVCDTNVDPRLITYPVPGNDDTPDAQRLYCELFKQAVLAGKQRRRELIGEL